MPGARAEDHPGAPTVVNGRPAFVDLFTSRLHTLDAGAFGSGLPLGVSLSPNSRPATQDTGGRVVILDQGRSSLVLVDIGTKQAPPPTEPPPPPAADQADARPAGPPTETHRPVQPPVQTPPLPVPPSRPGAPPDRVTPRQPSPGTPRRTTAHPSPPTG